jgi:hypothetical protein
MRASERSWPLSLSAASFHSPGVDSNATRAYLIYCVYVHKCFGAVAVGALLLLPTMLLARDAREQARIDFLIHGVKSSTGVKFIRNGKEYDGAAAAAHLRRKLGYAGEREDDGCGELFHGTAPRI